MTQLTFRPLHRGNKEDAFVARIYRRAVQASGLRPLHVPDGEMVHSLSGGMLHAVIGEIDGARASCLFVAKSQARLGDGVISFIGVDERYRRLGVGQATLRHGERLLAQDGCRLATLSCFRANQAAVAFYRHCGWVCSAKGSAATLEWIKPLPLRPVVPAMRHNPQALRLEGSAG